MKSRTGVVRFECFGDGAKIVVSMADGNGSVLLDSQPE